MFQRREQRTALQKLRETLWPSMGWKRACLYVKHRIMRLSDTNYSIAAGLAAGACISFTPFFGTHFLQAIAIAYLVRGNYFAAVIGTFWGNPWTFPFLLSFSLFIGNYILGLFGITDVGAVPTSFTWEAISAAMLPVSTGGYILAILSWPLYFGICYLFVREAKVARLKYKKIKAHRIAKEITGQKK